MKARELFRINERAMRVSNSSACAVTFTVEMERHGSYQKKYYDYESFREIEESLGIVNMNFDKLSDNSYEAHMQMNDDEMVTYRLCFNTESIS